MPEAKVPIVLVASSAHTGSTVLANVVTAILEPGKAVNWLPGPSEARREMMIVKTHSIKPGMCSIKNWRDAFPNRRLVIISSVRKDHPDYLPRNSFVTRVKYRNLAVSDEESVAKVVYDALGKILTELPPRKEAVLRAKQRLEKMNTRYEEIQHKPFSFYDAFFHLHGHHRGRRKMK